MSWWPFGRRSIPKSTEERLEECESTCRALKTAFKDIETDWELTYRKMHNALSSLNQKQRAAEKAVETLEDAPERTNVNEFTLMDVRRSRVLPR